MYFSRRCRPVFLLWFACLSATSCTADNPLYSGFFSDGFFVGGGAIEDMAGRDLAGRDLSLPRDQSAPVDLAQKPIIEVDIAEDASGWEVGESTSDTLQPCAPQRRGLVSIDDDPGKRIAGQESIRVSYGPNGSNYFQAVYPKARNAGWDLSAFLWVGFSVDALLPPGFMGWDPAGPTIVLCSRGGGYRRLQPRQNRLPRAGSGWVPLTVSLGGNNDWQASDQGNFNIARVDSIEFHADPQRGGGQGTVRMWLDSVRFF